MWFRTDWIYDDWLNNSKNIRLKIIDNFGIYINAIDVDNDSEIVISTGWLDRLNTPDISKIKRSQYGRGTDFKQDIFEHISNNCFVPTSTNCFINLLIL